MMKIDHTDLDYLEEPKRSYGKQLQDKMLELQLTEAEWEGDQLWVVAVDALGGNIDGRFDGFCHCQQCGTMYHSSYSTNSDPDRDFCDGGCEMVFFKQNPDAEYNGELEPNPWKYELILSQ